MDNYWTRDNGNIFTGLSDREIELLKRTSIPFKVSKDEIIFMQGDPSDCLYYLKFGLVKISRIHQDGRKLTLDIVESGEFFGEHALSGENERSNIAEAIADTSGSIVKKKAFMDFLGLRPDIAIKFLEKIVNKRLALEGLFENMIFMDVTRRVASLLLKYSEKSTVKLHFTHQELADMSGATRVSVSRAIIKLRNDGLIETNGERIKLTDAQRLREMLEETVAI